MTKKHFIALADMLCRYKPVDTEETLRDKTLDPSLAQILVTGRLQQWEILTEAIADFCASQNSEFKRRRWLEYIADKCGPFGGTAHKK